MDFTKNLKKNSIILLLITFVVLYFVVKDDFNDIMNILHTVNGIWIIIGFIVMALSVFFRSLALKEVVQGYNFKYNIKKAFKLELITSFFNGVTPFSTGGQPMQVIMLKEDGVRMTKGTNIIMMNFVLYQASLVFLGLIALGISLYTNMFTNNIILSRLILIGFIINTLVMLLLLIISYAKKPTLLAANWLAKFLEKIHIIKDRKNVIDNWYEKIDDFHDGAMFLKKNKINCFKGFVYHLLSLILLYLIPLFTFYAMHDYNSLNAINAIISSAYTMIIGAFVPIPGGSGGIEFGYARFVGNFANSTIVAASLLVWRLTTYYLPMIIGGVLFGIRKDDDK